MKKIERRVKKQKIFWFVAMIIFILPLLAVLRSNSNTTMLILALIASVVIIATYEAMGLSMLPSFGLFHKGGIIDEIEPDKNATIFLNEEFLKKGQKQHILNWIEKYSKEGIALNFKKLTDRGIKLIVVADNGQAYIEEDGEAPVVVLSLFARTKNWLKEKTIGEISSPWPL